ncbi:MAG: hypothetical protein KF812_08950 [Fimbriimonadaceae bacterium]|nr:hypothetical protein [Fimbriimonadaceae bacterium]
MRFLHGLSRLALRMGRLSIEWFPPLLILFFGGLYLLRLYNFFLAPGMPIRIEIPGGPTPSYARIGSYSVDLDAGRIYAEDVSWYEEDKDDIVAVGTLNAKQVGKSWNVTVRDVTGTVERGEDGRFPWDRLFPAPKPDQPPGPPWVAVVDQARVRIIDRTVEPPLVGLITLNNIWAEQSNRYTTISGFWQGGLGIERAPLSGIIHESGDSWIQIKGDNYDVNEVMAWARPWLPPDQIDLIDPLQAESLEATGTVVAQVKWGLAPRIAANLFVTGNRVKYPRYLDSALVDGLVILRDDQLQTDLSIRDNGRSLELAGLATLGEKPTWKGSVNASVRDRGALWADAANLLPQDIKFSGLNYDGWVVSDGKGVSLSGDAKVARLQVQGESASNLESKVVGDSTKITAQVSRADAFGSRWTGAVQYGIRSNTLEGFAKASSIPLGPLAQRFETNGLSGTANASLVLGGFVDRPDVRASIDGRGKYVTGDQSFDVESFSLRARLRGNELLVSRFLAETPEGFVVGQGSGDISTQTFNARYETSAVELARFNEKIEGLAVARGDLVFRDGRFATYGEASVYGFKAGDVLIPIVTAKVEGTNETVSLVDLRALVRGTEIKGKVNYDIASGALDGSIAGGSVLLADWGPENLGGQGQLLAARIRGTLESPEVAALFAFRNMDLAGVQSSSGSLVARLTGNQVNLETLRLALGRGELTASGVYSLDTEEYIVQALLNRADIRTRPNENPELTTTLVLDGVATIDGKGSDLTYALTNLTAQDIVVGGQSFGSGPITARWVDERVEFAAEFGNLDNFVVVRNGIYDPATNVLDARSELLGFEADSLVAAALRRETSLSADARRILRSLRGDVTVGADIHWTPDDLQVNADTVTVSALEIFGREAGTLTAAVLYGGDKFVVPRISWSEGVMATNASYSNNGDVEGTITVSDFDLIWAQLAYPEFNLPAGRFNLQARVRGKQDDLEGEGTAELTDLVFSASDGETSDPAAVRFASISIADGVISTEGTAEYRDLIARIGGAYVLETGIATGSIAVDEMAIAQLSQFVPDLRPNGTAGTIDGEVIVRFDGDRWYTSGGFDVVAESVALSQDEFSFGPSTAKIAFTENDEVEVNWNLTQPASIEGAGSTSGNVAVDIRGILVAPTDAEYWRDVISMRATAAFDNFRWSYVIPSADGASQGAISGQIQANGRVVSPRVTGELIANATELRLPTQPLPEGDGSLPPIDPEFVGVRLVVSPETRVLAPTLDLRLHGQGVLNGRFTAPTISLPLVVDSGVMTLPSATINLVPGGEIRVLFSGDTFSQSGRIDLDIEGTTILAARRDDRFRTYRVTIGIQGDLLSATDRLNFVASSEPGDLSSDEILAIIGQRDLIAGLTSGGLSSTDISRNLASALLPALTNASSRKLAESLGLDFLYFDYNPFDGAFVTLGKVLSRRLTFYLRRQLSQPIEGKLQYELSLEYDVPTIGGIVRELRLQYSIDQDVPWRFRLDWSRRF